MKAYRQTKSLYHQLQQNSQQYLNRSNLKISLRTLASNNQLKEISLNCNQSLLIIERPLFVNNRTIKKQEEAMFIYAGDGNINILKSCLEAYTNSNNKSYIFSTNLPGGAYKSRQRQIIKEKASNKIQIKLQNNFDCQQYFNQTIKQKYKQCPRSNQNMEIVEQRQSQYNQSQLQQPFNFQPVNRDKSLPEHLPKEIFETNQALPEKKGLEECQKHLQHQKENQNNQKNTEGNITSFSHIQNGYLACQSFKRQKASSFKLAGDQQIQDQKQNKCFLQSPEINSIKKPNQQVRKEQSLSQVVIKQDAQVIDSSKNLNHQNMLQAENEKLINEFVQISEKVIDNNRSQFYVKYNFKCIDKKSPNKVVRISPLRFRKKDASIILTNNKPGQDQAGPRAV